MPPLSVDGWWRLRTGVALMSHRTGRSGGRGGVRRRRTEKLSDWKHRPEQIRLMRGFSFWLLNGSARGASAVSALLQSLREDTFFLLLLLHPSLKPVLIYTSPIWRRIYFIATYRTGKMLMRFLPPTPHPTKAVIYFPPLPLEQLVNTVDI